MTTLTIEKCYNSYDCDSCLYYEECPMSQLKNHAYMIDIPMHQMVLCQGRHEIPEAVDGCIFEKIEDVTDGNSMFLHAFRILKTKQVKALELYITGLTLATLATVKACRILNIHLVTMNWDKETKTYIPFNM